MSDMEITDHGWEENYAYTFEIDGGSLPDRVTVQVCWQGRG